MSDIKQTYIAFLRGINVGGHHKVPMAELKQEMASLGFDNVVTLLNSGNVIFDAKKTAIEQLEKTISEHLERIFGFAIPTVIRSSETILNLLENNPFSEISLTKDIRLYVSFLKEVPETKLDFPWTNEDYSYQIISYTEKNVISVLDLSITKTSKGMEALEKHFGKSITTRNWNTIKRIAGKIN